MTGIGPTASLILRMEGVSKRYGGVRALENADLAISAGRIHAILGENGAGKSTLIKILSGVVRPDAGRIVLDGDEVAFDSPAAANRAGVVCIFQELSLVPALSVADNIAISNPPRRFGLINRRAQRRIAEDRVDAPRRDREIGVFQRAHPTVALRYALHAQDQRGRRFNSGHQRQSSPMRTLHRRDARQPRGEGRGTVGPATRASTDYLFSFVCPMISCAVKLMLQVGKELPTKKLSDWAA